MIDTMSTASHEGITPATDALSAPLHEGISTIVAQALSAFEQAPDAVRLEEAKSQYLGKTGLLTLRLKALGTLPVEDRKTTGAAINAAKSTLEEALDRRRESLRTAHIAAQLAAQSLDVTLPGRGMPSGAVHPINRTLARIETLFHGIGFDVADGPEIETDWYNFTALNTPKDHPARSMHDTFYLADAQGGVRDDIVLRTHTSPVQIRYMQSHAQRYRDAQTMPEIRIIAPGRVYRVDSDATHSPMFHQIEGLWVGETVSFADLKGVMSDFLRCFFESETLEVRTRPSFFPFTEPSAEIDVAFMHGALEGQWLEVAGCGMVHPHVLEACHIDSERYTGFAFGMGLDRLTMLRYSISDLRLFFEGDLRFLSQFSN
jgi:phenylalanyl-tRNA synthetase alpha chain